MSKMKYFIDTEFIEGFHKPLFGKRRHFIDLISIGIVREDGKELYLISSDYKYKDANKWVQENVITKMYIDAVHGDERNRLSAKNFHLWKGLPNKIIANRVSEFFGCWRDQHFYRAPGGIEVYGYYSDYDWVLFCSLFGRMIDLPRGFPMYCIDLKQTLDERANAITQFELTTMLVSGTDWKAISELPKKIINIDDYPLSHKIELLKSQPAYPKQENEHNALADAKWNYELYKFLLNSEPDAQASVATGDAQ